MRTWNGMVRLGECACFLCVLLASVVVIGCKTKPASDSGFLQESKPMQAETDRFPFQRVWVKPGISKYDYDYIMIAPVNTSYLLENTGWKAVNPGNATLDSAAKDLADYTEQKFREAFSSREANLIRLTDNRGPHTAVLELAIVELVPSKAVLGAIGLVAPVTGQPVVGVGAKAVAGKPSVAIEGRFKDSQSGEVLFTFADREERQWRVVDLKSVTWWGHAQPIINDWARQCVELTNTPKTYKVKDRSKFTLMPW